MQWEQDELELGFQAANAIESENDTTGEFVGVVTSIQFRCEQAEWERES